MALAVSPRGCEISPPQIGEDLRGYLEKKNFESLERPLIKGKIFSLDDLRKLRLEDLAKLGIPLRVAVTINEELYTYSWVAQRLHKGGLEKYCYRLVYCHRFYTKSRAEQLDNRIAKLCGVKPEDVERVLVLLGGKRTSPLKRKRGKKTFPLMRKRRKLNANDLLHTQKSFQHPDLEEIEQLKPTQVTSLTPELIDKVKVLLVTVKDAEFLAVLRKLKPCIGQEKVLRASPKVRESYMLGMFGKYCAALMQAETGPRRTQSAVAEALSCLKPKATIMIGTGYGLRPDLQKIGDVLVADRLKTYDLEKVQEGDKTVSLGVLVYSGRYLSPLFKAINTYDWKFNDSKVHRGLVLTGSKKVEKEDLAKLMLLKDSEALGGELEGDGLYHACNYHRQEWILVKGVVSALSVSTRPNCW